ncbi:MAG: Hpt domain-containing protein [Gammaproteobacteria bacterium]|nr:Hpt domain-containing protein [Gammaproteobacteria bacterium]
MDSATQEKILASVKVLQDKFRSNLRERFDAVEENLRQAVQDAQNGDIQKELYRSVHSMAGSSGTFGLPEVGDSARQLLNAIKDWQQICAQEPGASLVEEINVRLEALRQVVDQNAGN